MTDHRDTAPVLTDPHEPVLRLAGATATSAAPGTAHPTPSGERVAVLRDHMARLDGELIALIRRRTAVARRLGQARVATGGSRFVHDEEIALVRAFGQLGPAGQDLAMILVRLGR